MCVFAYVGCRTTKERGARGKGISVYRIDDRGVWTLVQLVEGLVNPSYLCFDRTGDFLYSVHGDRSEVSSFSVDGSTGALALLGTTSTGGTNPVHLSVDRTNRWVFVANLQTGNISVLPRLSDGALGPIAHNYVIPGNGEGDVSHPHQVMQDPTGDFLIVSCQGRNAGYGQVDVFAISHDDGSLERTCAVRSRAIAEPRHVAVHPNGKWVYGVNEKDYTVEFYEFDPVYGGLLPRQIVPTLPDTCTGDGWASGIVVSADGQHVIVSNRTNDSLSSFAVDSATGRLALRSCVPCEGECPRFITMGHGKDAVWAANEMSDTIVEFSLSSVDGTLAKTGRVISTPSPVCLLFSDMSK